MGFSTIPLPKVVSDVGPGGPLVTSENALLQNRILGAQAQYAPQQAQANAYLTAQQGVWKPFETLNNPYLLQAAQGNQLLQQQIKTAFNNLPLPSMANGGWPLPQPQQPTSPFNALMQKLGLSQSVTPSANAMPQMPQGGYGIGNNAVANSPMQRPMQSPMQQPSQQPMQQPQQGATGPAYDPKLQIPVAGANPQVAAPAAAPQPEQGTPTIQTPRGSPAGNYLGGDYSQMVTSPEYAKSLASYDVANMSAENKEALKAAQAGIQVSNLSHAYNEIMDLKSNALQGPVSGHVNPNGPTAAVLDLFGLTNLTAPQTAKSLNSQLQYALGSTGPFGNLHGPAFNFIRTLKYDPTMTPDARHNIENQMNSTLGRGAEELPFNIALDDPKLNASQTEKELLFTNYSKSYPPYELNKSGQIVSNPNSLNGTPLWKYWTTPQGINAARSGNTNWQPPGWDNVIKTAKQQFQATQNKNITPSDDDISFTAQKYNMTPQEVKDKLGIK